MLTQPRTQVLAFSFPDFRTLQHGSFHRTLLTLALLLFLDKNLTTIDRPRRRCAQGVQAQLQGHTVVADAIVHRAERSRPDVVARFGLFDAVIPLCCIAIHRRRTTGQSLYLSCRLHALRRNIGMGSKAVRASSASVGNRSRSATTLAWT